MTDQTKEQQDRLLESATKWQRRIGAAAVPIGNAIQIFLNHDAKQAVGNARVNERLNALLNQQFHGDYTLDRIEKGIVCIYSLPGPAAHQLKMMESEILLRINNECPRANLRSIRVIIKNRR